MMRFSLGLIVILALSFTAQAQESTTDTTNTSPWKFKGLSGLNMTQVGLSNWNGGGTSALSVTLLGAYSATYTKGKTRWHNSLNAAYGIQYTEELGNRKTDDRIEFVSKYGRTAFKKWRYTSVFNFTSQFQPGFQYPTDTTRVRISDWLAPGYINFSIGLEEQTTEWLTVFVSPLSAKVTVVQDEALSARGAFGVDSNKTARFELGGMIRVGIDATLMENVSYQSTLQLFSNYTENPENIDVNWDNLISFKVNKFLSTSLSVTVIYDDDIDIPVDLDDDGTVDIEAPRTQIKQVLSLGVQYQF